MLYPPNLRVAARALGCCLIVALSQAVYAGPHDEAAQEARPDTMLRQAPTPIVANPVLTQRMQDKASDVVDTAMNFLGLPYRRGGTTEAGGFDCSGFTRYMFEMSVGLVLPRRVDDQAAAPGLASVKRSELQPGDLVFFNTLRRTFSHVGIYIGEGKFIHAPRSGAEVRVENMGLAYWAKRFTGARRADPDVDPMAPHMAAVRKATATR